MSSRLLTSILAVSFLLLHLQSNGVVECAKVKCVSHGTCGCKLDNGGGIIDLSPMIAAAGQSPMFKNVKSNTASYTFNVDICSDFSCGAQQQSRVCLQVQSYLSMSVGKTLTFDYDATSGVVTFVYSDTASGQQVSTRILMHCSGSAAGIGSLAPIEADPQSSHYTSTLTSKYACFSRNGGGSGGGSGGGLSIGSILCIVLLVIVVIYLVAGILINKFIRKPDDATLAPNKEFWTKFPGFVKDGFSFTVNKVKSKVSKNGEYESI